ncbi:hypothetical protein HNY73_010044 [Argiope bruennichi]|uniref:Uncharacterized protein n=1 Tax=Argiope bruennichi TaxID=94029 RepID=A0A8T0EZR2_ARGBR|nr:hypothetical protein HNY73_010044 [Argiope bruennichi]
MEEIKQDSDEDNILISSDLILTKKRVLLPKNFRRDLKSFKDLIETERKWKYRKKTSKFQQYYVSPQLCLNHQKEREKVIDVFSTLEPVSQTYITRRENNG